jgi:hypothetical protein
LANASYLHSRKSLHSERRTTWVGRINDGRQALRDRVAGQRQLIDVVAD